MGSDLPVGSDSEGDSTSSGGSSGFAWCDGVFLRALKAGHWVLLDELNLAPQVWSDRGGGVGGLFCG